MTSEAGRRPRALRLTLMLCAVLLMAGFIALGTWQIQRLYWKNALIERIEQRVHDAPGAPPEAANWAQFQASAAFEEYRRVRLSGVFLDSLSTPVQASTVLGSGFWLLTPLCRTDGTIVLVNRGFLAPGPQTRQLSPSRASGDACAPIAGSDAQAGAVVVTGLLRLSEPGGAFLRHNDALANRWYSRDVPAIAGARGLTRVAPFFVDAGAGAAMLPNTSAAANPAKQPVGGLTVIHFNNNHLVYALTWYALAAMVAAACVWLVREERGRR
ncbi:MAG: SURF1 family protein [Massilia sp.]|nr:SURF1 family protein [Massilia sp.]